MYEKPLAGESLPQTLARHNNDADIDDDTDDDHDDDTDDDNDHKNDSYTAAGAAPGASIISIYLYIYISMGPLWGPRVPIYGCLLYTSPSPRDRQKYRMPSSA